MRYSLRPNPDGSVRGYIQGYQSTHGDWGIDHKIGTFVRTTRDCRDESVDPIFTIGTAGDTSSRTGAAAPITGATASKVVNQSPHREYVIDHKVGTFMRTPLDRRDDPVVKVVARLMKVEKVAKLVARLVKFSLRILFLMGSPHPAAASSASAARGMVFPPVLSTQDQEFFLV